METKVTGRQEKIKVVGELHKKFGKAEAVILTDYRGLNVAQLTEMRNRLRGCRAEYRVIKNTLALRAAEGTDVSKVGDHFTGTTGVIISYDDIVTPVRVLTEYINKFEAFKVKAAVLEGIVFDPARLKGVANLPSREVLIGKAVGSIKAPLCGLVGTLQGVMRSLIFVLKALEKSLEKFEAAP